jgi:hypothetical protein
MSSRKKQKTALTSAPSTKHKFAKLKSPPVNPTFPVASASRDVLRGVKVKKGKLIVPFETHQELANKLAHLTTHILDAQSFGAVPALVPTDTTRTIPYNTGTDIVVSCADSNDWSMVVGDCVPDIDTFRSCLAQKILASGFNVPDLTKFNAKSTLDAVLTCVLGAWK